MLSRLQRLRAENDIAHVLRCKVGVFDDVCGVRFAKNDLNISRVAFSVGKKVSLLAVTRNRVRRQFRALFASTHEEWPVGYDYVFLIGKSALPLTYAEKQRKFLEVLRKVRARVA